MVREFRSILDRFYVLGTYFHTFFSGPGLKKKTCPQDRAPWSRGENFPSGPCPPQTPPLRPPPYSTFSVIESIVGFVEHPKARGFLKVDEILWIQGGDCQESAGPRLLQLLQDHLAPLAYGVLSSTVY